MTRKGPRRMFKKAGPRGRSERKSEAYFLCTSQDLSDVRTKLASFFNILLGSTDPLLQGYCGETPHHGVGRKIESSLAGDEAGVEQRDAGDPKTNRLANLRSCAVRRQPRYVSHPADDSCKQEIDSEGQAGGWDYTNNWPPGQHERPEWAGPGRGFETSEEAEADDVTEQQGRS